MKNRKVTEDRESLFKIKESINNKYFNEIIDGRTRIEWIDFCNRYIKRHEVSNYEEGIKSSIPSIIKWSLPVAAILVLILFTLFIGLRPTGLATMNTGIDYIYNASLFVNESSEYDWILSDYGSLKSIRLDGSISKDFVGKVYLRYKGKDYLIFDSSKLKEEGISEVVGLVVTNQSSLDNESGEIIDVINESKSLKNKINNKNNSIIITTQGGGSKALDEIFEFNVGGEFGWEVDYNKLCTKWDINLISVCYGSSNCCAFIGLDSLGKWNDSLYLSYGRYDSGLSSKVKAQIVYYDVDLNIPYSDIVYSNISTLEARFYEARIEFKDFCIETCLLPGFNESRYRLFFDADKGNLIINNIRYRVEKEVNISKNPPLLIKDIKNITIYKNEYSVINLSGYFYDEDGDKLNYTSYEVDNITLIVEDSIVRIIPEYNFTGRMYMYFIASDGYYTLSSNLFSINVIEKPSSISEVNISEELIKPRVIINQPVRWIKRVNASSRVINLSVNISSDALNVTVRDVKEDRVIEEDKVKIVDEGVIKNASAYRAEKRIEQIKKIEDRLDRKKMKIIMERPTDKEGIANINKELLDLENERNKLTGYVVVVREKGLLTKFFEWLFNVEITGYVVAEPNENETLNVTSVIIEDIVEEVEIEYYTEAPVSEEKNITNGKRIVVSSALHYENILAYTYLNDVSQTSIKLYRIVNDSKELVMNVSYYDENNNSLVDKIEWIIPSLSNETYEVIIEITKAEHLDENRTFIADIYEQVKALDGNWSEPIPAEHYVRVTFEKPLDRTKDITIYARSNDSNSSASIEVYTKDNNTLITKFENITTENWYKVYLTNLEGSYDNETEILTREEVNCDDLEVDDGNHLNENKLPDLPKNKKEKRGSGNKKSIWDFLSLKLVPSLSNQRFSGLVFENQKRGSRTDRRITETVGSPRVILNKSNSYINISVYKGNAEVPELADGAVLRTVASPRGIGVRASMSEIPLLSALNDSNKKCYKFKWKYFYELTGKEKVMTLDAETGENEWQLPMEYQVFDYNKDMYKIELEDGSDLLVSENHRVYATENQYNSNGVSFNVSFTGSTSNPSDWRTTTPNNTLSTKLEIQTGKASSLPLTFIQALPLSILTVPAPVLTCSLETGLIPSSSASFLGRAVKLAPVSTKALTTFECFFSKSDISISTDVCPIMYNNRERYLNLTDFKLQPITENYEDYNEGKEFYFLDSKNKPVKIKNITKEPYSGKIYDVDVENDIVLVRRNNGNAIWSGNSNSYDTFDLKIKNAAVEFDYIVDPTINITESQIVSDSILYNVTAESNFTHISTSSDYITILYLPFDGDKNNTAGFKAHDFTKYNHDGTAYGNAVVNNTNCIYDDCLQLDGNGDYINLSYSTLQFTGPSGLGKDYTYSVWFNANSAMSGNSAYIMADGKQVGATNGWRLIWNTDNKVYFCDHDGVIGGDCVNTGVLGTGKWYHVVAIYNDTGSGNADLAMFLNGSIVGTKNSVSFSSSTDNFTIGVDFANNKYFNGLIDEVMVYNTTRNSSQISDIYNNRTERFYRWGTQQLINQTYLNITSGNNRVNVTTTFEANLRSAVNLSVGYYDGSWSFTLPQTLTSEQIHTFNISSTSTNLTLNYTLIAGNSTNPFYSPIIKGNITLTIYFIDNIPPTITFTNPTPADNSGQSDNYIVVNVSVNDTNNISTFIDFDNSLVSWWRMDDVNASGDPTDYTNRNNGSKQGNAAQTSAGKMGKGFSFDGDGDYISTNLNINTSQNINISFCSWINFEKYPGGTNSNYILYDFTTTIRLFLYGTKYIIFDFYNSTGDRGNYPSYSTPINNSIWHHVCGIRNDTNKLLSIDGAIVSTKSYGGGGADHATNTFSVSISGTSAFNGTIDDVMIFNRSLSADEIQALYANTSSKYLGVNFTSLAEGSHTFKAYAQDTAGNVNSTETRTVKTETGTTVTICRQLNLPNTLYNQTANINANRDPCINITANNVTFDCRGYWIRNISLDGTGVYSNQINTTIKNCNITMSANTGYGIYLLGVRNSTILNNILNNQSYGLYLSSTHNATIKNNTANRNSYGITISSSNFNEVANNTVNNNSNTGIYIPNSIGNTIANNTINSNPNGIYLAASDSNQITNNIANSNSYGIYLVASSTNNITNNTINSNQYGIYLTTASNSNTFTTNSVWNCSYGGSCIYISGSNSIVFDMNKINLSSALSGTGGNGVFITSSSHTLFKNTNMTNIENTAVVLSGTDSLNNTFLNFTYNNESVDSGSELIRKWYYRAYVNDTAKNPVGNANVLAYSKSYTLVENITTNSSGWTNISSLIEYVNTGSITYYSNYTIWAKNSSPQAGYKKYNVSANLNNLNHIITIPTGISDCVLLPFSHLVYNQSANIINNDLTDDCIIVLAQNITFNCKDYYIKSDDAYSGVFSNKTITTIRNCNITMSPSFGGFGIEMHFANNSYIYNNTLNSQYYGLFLSSSDYLAIGNTTANSNIVGINLNHSSNNNLTNINIWNCTTTSYSCLYLYYSNYNNISKGIINLSSNALIKLYNSSNNTFSDLLLYNGNISDINLSATSTSITFLNVSYNISKENVATGSDLTRKGYVEYFFANVTYFGDYTPISGANVTLRNTTNNVVLIYNISGVGGLATLNFSTPTLLDFYLNNGGTRTNYIHLSTTATSYLTEVTTFNWNNLLIGRADITNTTTNVTMHYSTYTVAITQTLDDVYNSINDNNTFRNASTGTDCHYIANVSLDVASGGTLIIERCILEMASWGASDKTLYVSSGGILIANYSNITAYVKDEANNYNFYGLSGSTLTLKNSYIDYVGTDEASYKSGLEINSSTLLFDNITMSINQRALTLWAPNLTIQNSRISGSTSTTYGDNVRIANYGIRIVNCSIFDPATGFDNIVIDANMNATVLNSSYEDNVGFQTNAKLFRNWYYRAYVNDTLSNPIELVNVTDYDNSSNFQFNLTTDSTGYTPVGEITEYMQNGTRKFYYNNHSIFANKTGYTGDWHYYNVSVNLNNFKDVFTLTDNVPPQINFTAPTPSNGTIQSQTYVPVNVSIIESSLGEIKYNWNGTNYTVYNDSLILFMNFDNRSALGENNTKAVDISRYGNNGTFYGQATINLSGGKYAGGLKLDGTGDYINASDIDVIDYAIQLSGCAWVYHNSLSNDDSIINKNSGTNDGFLFFRDDVGTSRTDTYVIYIAESTGTGNVRVEGATGASVASTWTHVCFTYIENIANGLRLYINGIEDANSPTSTSGIIGIDSGINMTAIGRDSTSTARDFNGYIDDVMIWNRSLSKDEIYQSYVSNLYKYNQSQWYLYANQSKNSTNGLVDSVYTYFASAKDTFGNENRTETRTITIDTIQPGFSNNQTNSTSTTPKINDILQLNITVNDSVDVNSIKLAHNQSGTLTNTTTLNYTGTSDTSITAIFNLTITMSRGLMQWQIWANDSVGNVNVSQQFTVEVQNSPPSTVNLSYPLNNTADLNTTTPRFNWTNATDADGDRILYDIFINCTGTCSVDNRDVYNITDANYTPSDPLRFYADDGYSYKWWVRAFDNFSYSENSSKFNFSIQSSVVISILNSTVSFGAMSLNQQDDTTDNNPHPMIIINDGNSYINVNITVDQYLWISNQSPSQYFQYKIDNVTVSDQSQESGAFNSSASATSWTYFNLTNITSIYQFNYSDDRDSAEVDINITVPPAEPPTEGGPSRNSTILFTGYYVRII